MISERLVLMETLAGMSSQCAWGVDFKIVSQWEEE